MKLFLEQFDYRWKCLVVRLRNSSMGWMLFKILTYAKSSYKFYCLLHRLKKKGWNRQEQLEILTRYVSMKNHLRDKDAKRLQKANYQKIVKIAEIMDIEQWEVRAIIESDTGLDI